MHIIIKNPGNDTLRVVGIMIHDDQLGHPAEFDRLLEPGEGADLDDLPDAMEISVRKFVEVEAAGQSAVEPPPPPTDPVSIPTGTEATDPTGTDNGTAANGGPGSETTEAA